MKLIINESDHQYQVPFWDTFIIIASIFFGIADLVDQNWLLASADLAILFGMVRIIAADARIDYLETKYE